MKKRKQISLTISDSQKFSFRPRDFFFHEGTLVVIGDSEVAIAQEWGRHEYHFPNLGESRLQDLSMDSGAISFYSDVDKSFLFYDNAMHDLSLADRDIKGLMLCRGEVYRFSKKHGEKREKIALERAALLEDFDVTACNWRRDDEIYDQVLFAPSGTLLMRYATRPLPGVYLTYLPKTGDHGFSEVYFPFRLDNHVHVISSGHIYFIEDQKLHHFSPDGKRQNSLALGQFPIKNIAVEGKRVVLLDYNNFLHFFYKEKFLGKSKLPGNFYGLHLHDGDIYMADRNDNSIKTMNY